MCILWRGDQSSFSPQLKILLFNLDGHFNCHCWMIGNHIWAGVLTLETEQECWSSLGNHRCWGKTRNAVLKEAVENSRKVVLYQETVLILIKLIWWDSSEWKRFVLPPKAVWPVGMRLKQVKEKLKQHWQWASCLALLFPLLPLFWKTYLCCNLFPALQKYALLGFFLLFTFCSIFLWFTSISTFLLSIS